MQPETVTNTITVNPGDTLSGIARSNNTTVQDIVRANPTITDPNRIRAGATLSLPSVIPAQTLTTQTPTPTFPQPQQQTNPADFVASLQVPTQIQPTDVQNIEQERTGILDTVRNLFTQRGQQGQALLAEEARLGIPEQQRQLGELNVRIAQLTGEFDRAAQALEAQPILGAIVQGQQGQVRRQQAIEVGALASVAQALAGNIQLAQQTAKRAVDLKFEPIQAELDFAILQLEENKANLTRAEKRQADERQAQLEAERDNLQQFRALQNSYLSAALERGANENVVRGLMNATTVNELSQFAGQLPADRLREAQIASQRASTRAANALATQRLSDSTGTVGSTGTLPQEFAPVVDIVANLEPTVSGKEAVSKQLSTLISRGDFGNAYNQIVNTIERQLPGEQRNRLSAARTDIEVLNGFRNALIEYEAAGGNMGLLRGTAEQIERKLGNVRDPRLTQVAVQLQREFQTYRQQMTGAAFSPAESREYASVNPTSSKSLDLNFAVIDGALNQLNNRVNATVDTYAPAASTIRSRVPERQTMQRQQTSTMIGNATGGQNTSTLSSLFNSIFKR